MSYDKTGLHPEIFSGTACGATADAPGHDLQLPFEQEYREVAPHPENWPALLAKAVAMFRLLGGGVLGDLVPLPAAQFAVLPGTSHIG